MKQIALLGAAILGGSLISIPASAQILLTINDTNSSAVIITATGMAPAVNSDVISVQDGIDLLAFLTSPLASSEIPIPESDLMGGGVSVSYNEAYVDNYSGSDIDLNIFSNSGSDTQNFSTSQPAFTGTATLDLSGFALPTAGASGEIIVGYNGSGNNEVIGTWQVVSAPEPGTNSLLAVGLLAAGFMTYRRRAKSSM